jgi:3-deoxy-manno-octulosonate cytidylyltransferase (CMP-KDO synthetase)
MKILGIIPARYASTRFPAKPLVDIYGKTMIQRVYEQANQSSLLTYLAVATDDQRIYDTVKSFGGNVFMTSENHRNGTERCAEVAGILEEEFDIIINIQGDEPFFESDSIRLIATCFQNKKTDIATLIKKIDKIEDLENPTVVKAVIAKNNKALYFSRLPIPFYRDDETPLKIEKHTFYKHIGIYAYRPSVLKEIVLLSESNLEKAESLEQLRWLENGYNITTNITTHDSNSVDTPEDLAALMEIFSASYFK